MQCSCGHELLPAAAAAPPRARRLRCSNCGVSTTVNISNHHRRHHHHPTSHPLPIASPSHGSSTAAAAESRKRALLCGVSYLQQKRKYRLEGTINDVMSMKTLLLQRFHFPPDSIRILTEKMDPEWIPNRRNMESSLHWLVKDCRPGDSLVFFFSGHGLRQLDFDGDEIDGFDETLCPSDFLSEGKITDNYINDSIVRPLKTGITLHAIVDACHSGTILDLDYIFDRKSEGWKDNKPPSGTYKGTDGGLAVCFSACADNQKASDTDAFTKKSMGGVLTSTFVQAIENQPDITYGHLLVRIQEAINEFNNRGRFKFHFFRRVFHRLLLQEPQLSSSANFDLYNKVLEL